METLMEVTNQLMSKKDEFEYRNFSSLKRFLEFSSSQNFDAISELDELLIACYNRNKKKLVVFLREEANKSSL